MGVLLYTGAEAKTIQGRRFALLGRRCFSGAYGPNSLLFPDEVPQVVGLLDSGAFSDAPEDRLCPEGALTRQLAWEARASAKWGAPFVSEALVSYDLLIDEKWSGGQKRKSRWSVADADAAVRVTVDAATFLAGRRRDLAPRQLVLACQGVDDIQYEECAREVLAHALPGDWLGLGGWCILGMMKRWIPTFWRSMDRVLPLVAEAGLSRVHIFGVMYLPVLGRLLWLCDRHGLELSTDSSKPAMASTWADAKKAGAVADTWEESCRIWQHRLANLRTTRHYRAPDLQLTLF